MSNTAEKFVFEPDAFYNEDVFKVEPWQIKQEIKKKESAAVIQLKNAINYAAWREHNLNHLLVPIQLEINNAIKAELKDKIWTLNCSRRVGKTRGTLIYCFERLIARPNTKIFFCSAYEKHLKRHITPEVREILATCPNDMRPKQRGESYFEFPNGSSMELIGLDLKAEGLRGNKANIIVIDEASQVKDLNYVVRNLAIATTSKQHDPKIILMSTPHPRDPENHFKAMFFRHRDELKKNYFQFTIHDSTMHNEDDVEELCREYPNREKSIEWQTEYLCKFVIDENLKVIPEWETKYELNPEEYRKYIDDDQTYKYHHKYVSIDPGYKDKTSILFGFYIHPLALLIIQDEITTTTQENTVSQIADMIKVKEKELWGDHKVHQRTSDNNDPRFLDELERLGVYFSKVRKDDKDVMVNGFRDLVRRGRVRVNSTCRFLLGCLENGVWKSTGVKREYARSDTYGHYDALDSIIYMIRTIDLNRNPVPPNLEDMGNVRVQRTQEQQNELDKFGSQGKKLPNLLDR